jgi:hypothetical protein
VLYECHVQFYTSYLNFNSNIWGNFWVIGLGVVLISGLYFWVFDHLYFGGCNILNSNLFLTSFSASDAPTGRVQVLFGHQKQQNLPLNQACPEHLSDCSWAVLPKMQKKKIFVKKIVKKLLRLKDGSLLGWVISLPCKILQIFW